MGEVDRKLDFVEMVETDIPALAAVMKLAFDDDARKHLGQVGGGPPGYDDGEFFRIWLLPYQESVGYKIFTGGTLIGGIIVWILPEGHNILGTIFIHPEFQDRGVGSQTWAFIERTYPDTRSWRLATPTWAVKNHHFYTKCGFVEIDSDHLIPAEPGTSIYKKLCLKDPPPLDV